MTKRTIGYLVMALAIAVVPAVWAQSGGGYGQGQTGQGRHDRMGPGQNLDAHVQMLTKELQLTDDQQKQVKSILEDQQKQMESLRSDSSMSQQDRRAKFQEMHQSTTQKIREVLNPDQQKKYDDLEQKRRERMQQHERGQAGPPQQ